MTKSFKEYDGNYVQMKGERNKRTGLLLIGKVGHQSDVLLLQYSSI